MKKTIVKALSVMMAVVLIFAAAPLSGYVGVELPDWFDASIKASAATYSGTFNESLTWNFDTSTGKLTISGVGEIPEYIYPSDTPWFDYMGEIKTLEITDGVTAIGAGAFFCLGNLVSATIGNDVKTIGEEAFLYCVNLADIKIGNNVTSIGDGAFVQCVSLEEIVLPDSVKTIGNEAFGECTGLKAVSFGNNVASIGDYAFASCVGLEGVTIPDSVATIGEQAFCGCVNLAEVTFGNGVKTIGEMAFGSCTSLKNVTIPDSVTKIDKMAFAMCDALETVTLGNGITTINYATFLQCKNLKSIAFGKNVTTIGEMAFSECTGLKEVTIPDSVTTIGDSAFLQCSNLEAVTFGKNVTTIGGMAFANCESLKAVVIPDGVATINYGTFLQCSNLESVAFGKNVATIGEYAFSECEKLGNVTFPDSVTKIDYGAFLQCTGLTEITIPANLTEIASVAFANCDNITEIIVDSNNQYYLTDNDGVLYNKDKTTLILYPAANTRTIYTIPASVQTIENSAFHNCVALTDVYYNGSEEEWTRVTIGEDNDTLQKVNLHYNKEHSHIYSEIVAAPTCTEKGYTKYICSCGDSYIDNYVEARHTVENVFKAATCEADGSQYDACIYCGEVFSEVTVFPATGHTEVEYIDNEVKPTCNKAGSYDKVVGCSVCNKEFDRETVVTPATGVHAFVSELINEATCENTGLEIYTCSCGEEYEEVLPALGHNYEITIYEPTCSIDGHKEYVCSNCGDAYIEMIPTTGEHNFAIEKGRTEPTCSEEGYITYACGCGETKIEYIPAIGHSFESTVVAPTCTTKGYTKYECSKCGDSYKADETAELGHDIVIDKAVPATCTETGLAEGSHCSRCDGATVEQSVIPAKGHTKADAVRENEVPSTCSKEGSFEEVVYCAVCKAQISRVEKTVDKLPHSYNNGEVTKEATCTENGVKTYTCSCGASYTEEITALGHTEEIIPAVAPTCTADGLTEGVKCSRCGAVLVTPATVNALGHTAGEPVVENEVPSTCSKEGSFEEVVYCAVCKAQISRVEKTVNKLPHSYNNGEVTKEATCTENGVKTYTCSCGASYTEEITALGHTEEIIPAVAPTCTADGLTEGVKCSRCGAVLVTPATVNALGHTAGEPVVENEVPSTCTAEGSYDSVIYCTVCNAQISRESKVIEKIPHKYESVVTAPTCTTGGYTTYTCICGDTYTADEIPATGHSFVEGVCSICGEKDSSIVDVLVGDVDNDGKINQKDRVRLTRYLAKWDGYSEDGMNMAASDVNADGKVNQLDRTILTRYIAKWEGYETLPFKKK